MNKALFSVPFHLHKLLLYGSPFRLDTTEQETCSVAVPSWLLEILKSLNDLFFWWPLEFGPTQVIIFSFERCNLATLQRKSSVFARCLAFY